MRSIIGSFLSALLISFLWVQFAQADDKFSVSEDDLEAEFETVISVVKDNILDAPEASEVYLEHWIKVYNDTVSSENKFRLKSFELPIKNLSDGRGFGRNRNFDEKAHLGSWQPNGYPIVSPEWSFKIPAALKSPNQFRPPPPPDIKDPFFINAFHDVRTQGDLHSSVRTAEQSLIAAFWANGTGTETPPGRWNLVALETSRHLPRHKRVQIMLSLNIALYDAGIAAWDSKYFYRYWRPQTAITAISAEDAEWEPMMQPPFHPEYVSGHSAFSGAAAEVLGHYLGVVDFCIIATELSDLKRCYKSFDEAALEAGRSRVFGGIHFQFSNDAGLELGGNVAKHVIATSLHH